MILYFPVIFHRMQCTYTCFPRILIICLHSTAFAACTAGTTFLPQSLSDLRRSARRQVSSTSTRSTFVHLELLYAVRMVLSPRSPFLSPKFNSRRALYCSSIERTHAFLEPRWERHVRSRSIAGSEPRVLNLLFGLAQLTYSRL